MKIVKSFILNSGQKVLIKEDQFNQENQVISTKEFDNNLVVLTRSYQYDASGNMIVEEEKSENGKVSVQYTYNDQNQLIKLKQFFNDDLYETHIYDIVEQTLIVDKLREEVLFERYVKKDLGNGSYQEEFFNESNQRVELHKASYQTESRTLTHEYYDAYEQLIATSVEKFNEADFLIFSEEKDGNGNTIKSNTFEIENNKITKHLHTNFTAEIQETETINEYDHHGNLTRQTTKDASNGKVIAQYWSKYNEQNELIEEFSNRLGSFNSITGIMNNGESVHHVYEIEHSA